MAGKALQDASNNLTTIDAIDHERRTMFLAIHVNDGVKVRTGELVPWQGTITYPLYTNPTSTSPGTRQSLQPPRTFAIVRTPPGSNPWDLGKLGNLRVILGQHWYDWLLPLRFSPCCGHDRGDSLYAVGPEMDRLRREAGLARSAGRLPSSHSSERKRRRRKTRRPSDESLRSMETTLANVNGSSGLGGQLRGIDLPDDSDEGLSHHS